MFWKDPLCWPVRSIAYIVEAILIPREGEGSEGIKYGGGRDKLDRQVGSGVKVEVQGDEMGRMMERWWHGKIGILMK